MELLWKNKDNFDDIFFIVSGALLGWVTDRMTGVYMCSKNEEELELVFFFRESPTDFDNRIVQREILSTIQDDIGEYGIKRVKYVPIVWMGTLGEYKTEQNGGWVNNYWPVFQKYQFQEFDEKD